MMLHFQKKEGGYGDQRSPVGQVIRVSIETMNIVNALPREFV